MRVIAGTHGGRPLRAPRGRGTRPTSDRVREALFSVLGDVAGDVVLDLYAGSGALAIEAISRGAARAVCVERAPLALRCIEQNLTTLGLADSVRVIAAPVERAAKLLAALGPFDLVLVDPPWADVASGRATRSLVPLLRLAAPGACLVLEHAARDAPPELAGASLERTRHYGDTALSVFTLDGPLDAPGKEPFVDEP